MLPAIGSFHRVGTRDAEPAMGGGIAVVEHHQRPIFTAPVGVGENIFIHVSFASIEIVKQKVPHLSKKVASMEQRRDLTLVASHQQWIRLLIVIGTAILHAVA